MEARGRPVASLGGSTYLFHDACLPLAEGDVAPRLVLDELDVDLATLASGLVLVVVVVVGRRLTDARALGASGFALGLGTGGAGSTLATGRGLLLLLVGIGDLAHGCCTIRVGDRQWKSTSFRERAVLKEVWRN